MRYRDPSCPKSGTAEYQREWRKRRKARGLPYDYTKTYQQRKKLREQERLKKEQSNANEC